MRPTFSEFSRDIQPIWRVTGSDAVPMRADGSKFHKHFGSLLEQPAQPDADDDFDLVQADDLSGFAAGALIATPQGERAVEDLKIGDLVKTMDHGPQPIRWIGRQTSAVVGDQAPIHIPAGVLGAQQALKVGPRQRMHIAVPMMDLLFGFGEGLAEVKDLIDGAAIGQAPDGEVQFFQLSFDEHQIIWANGVATESLLRAEPAAHEPFENGSTNIERFFPELAENPPRKGLVARPLLQRHEARVVMSYVKSPAGNALSE